MEKTELSLDDGFFVSKKIFEKYKNALYPRERFVNSELFQKGIKHLMFEGLFAIESDTDNKDHPSFSRLMEFIEKRSKDRCPYCDEGVECPTIKKVIENGRDKDPN